MEFSEKRDVYADIATLYYLGDLHQDEIARIYNISRFKVSRVLKKCKSQKIVTFQINASENRSSALAIRLKERLNIETVIIAPSGATEADSKNNVGQMAAKYLQSAVKDNMYVGVGWGSTIQTIPRYYAPSASPENITFVQLSGSICSKPIIDLGYMDGSEIIRSLAAKTGAETNWSSFLVPYIVTQPVLREMLLQEKIISDHIRLFDRLDIACIGVGSDLPSRSVAHLSGYISLQESRELVTNGHAADVGGIRLSADGSIAHTILDNRVLTISPEALRKVPLRVAVAAGTDKAQSLVAGVRAELINVMVIDEIAALSTLNYLTSAE